VQELVLKINKVKESLSQLPLGLEFSTTLKRLSNNINIKRAVSTAKKLNFKGYIKR
jgi:hypothetical protein